MALMPQYLLINSLKWIKNKTNQKTYLRDRQTLRKCLALFLIQVIIKANIY